MKNLDKLPFKVGQLAEAKSFQKGYRGAWFRCKIHEIDGSKDLIRHALEFIDFPDEKVKWTKIYQIPYWRKGKEKIRELMVRPQYPRSYNEIQIPSTDRIAEVIVSFDDVWKVGDLVDWLTTGCYWTGRVTQLLGNGKAMIMLLQYPEGEGGSYEVSCKELRPSLDWSPKYGWSIPTLQEGDNSYNYARLIQQFNQGVNSSRTAAVGLYNKHCMDEGSKVVEDKVGSPVNASVSSHISANSLPASDKSNQRKRRDMSEPSSITVPKTQAPERNDLDMRDSSMGKPSLSDSVSSSHIKPASVDTAVDIAGEDFYNSAGSLKKLKSGGSVPLNIMFSDSLDAVILDFEELVNRIQWLKDIVEFSHDVRPPWKFVEHRASSTLK